MLTETWSFFLICRPYVSDWLLVQTSLQIYIYIHSIIARLYDARYWYGISVCPPVCPSLCDIVSERMHTSSSFSPSGRAIILVFWAQLTLHNTEVRPSTRLKLRERKKVSFSTEAAAYLENGMRRAHTSLIGTRSTCATFNDLEWPWFD